MKLMGGRGGTTLDGVKFRAPLAWLVPLLALAWLWFRLLDHLRVEWTVNPQYNYGWAVPALCLYLVWRRLKGTGEQRSGKVGRCEGGKVGRCEGGEGENAETLSQETQDHGPKTVDNGTIGLSDYPTIRREKTETIDYRPKTVDWGNVGAALFVLLALAYLPVRLIEEANPEWRLVSWALALIVLGLTYLSLSGRRGGGEGGKVGRCEGVKVRR